jgi:hypothetical protein
MDVAKAGRLEAKAVVCLCKAGCSQARRPPTRTGTCCAPVKQEYAAAARMRPIQNAASARGCLYRCQRCQHAHGAHANAAAHGDRTTCVRAHLCHSRGHPPCRRPRTSAARRAPAPHRCRGPRGSSSAGWSPPPSRGSRACQGHRTPRTWSAGTHGSSARPCRQRHSWSRCRGGTADLAHHSLHGAQAVESGLALSVCAWQLRRHPRQCQPSTSDT